MSINIIIPSQLNRFNIHPILKDIISPDLKPKSNEMSFDLTKITWMDPAGIVALFNIGKWLQEFDEVKATFSIAKRGTGSFKNRKAMEFLEDCGFFEAFFDKKDVYKAHHDYRPTSLPIRTLAVSESYTWRQNTLKHWLQTCTNRNLEFSSIQVGVEEIFNNIADHSDKKIGCVFGQYFPQNKDRLVIAISDVGRGIPTVMREKYSGLKDHELLVKALEEGVSTQSQPGNRGAGLPNIVRSLTARKVGTVHIMTNYAIMTIRDGKAISCYTTKNFYPGTFFEIEIDIHNEALYEGEEEDDFLWF